MKQKYAYLLEQKIVTDQDLQKAISLSKHESTSVEAALINQFNVEKEEIGKCLSAFYGCRFIAYDPLIPLASEIISVSKLEKSALQEEYWVPLNWDEKNGVEVLVDDPHDMVRAEHIKMALQTTNVFFSVGTREDIEKFVNRIFHQMEAFNFDFDKVTESDCENVTELVDHIILSAYHKKASDIHIEQSDPPEKSSIRFRLDGVCREYMKVPSTVAVDIAKNIKSMANLNTEEVRLPQNGRIKFRQNYFPGLELCVATYPTADSQEDVVLRISEEMGPVELEELVLNETTLSEFIEILKMPYGLFLFGNAIGSGTTTLVHAILHNLNKPRLKILTAEDPVEIRHNGLRQLEINPQIGLDFPSAIRSFFRADPDIIMIGEMNDRETASLCIKSAKNGYQVFSMLPTESMAGLFERLRYFDLNPFDLSDTLLGVFAQKLVRRLCSECREPYHPTKDEYSDIIREFEGVPTDDPSAEHRDGLTWYRSAGCQDCSETGYRGRAAIAELLKITTGIRSLIKKKASFAEIAEQASNEGMLTLRQDAILKVFKGITDLYEIRRVCSMQV